MAYFSHLRYWSQPPYVSFLRYSGPTLRMLKVLWVERFRWEVLGPGVGRGLAGVLLRGGERVTGWRWEGNGRKVVR
jgi:hypothetical protein